MIPKKEKKKKERIIYNIRSYIFTQQQFILNLINTQIFKNLTNDFKRS